ncbi:hypothetical protein [Microbacterium sp.]|uniref:hypothetical protein n=1 Tax=Microbacterium sp. TaxID=51671 RepID=UPI0028118A51|nr:hypothetical protein [Microbacterium sp.]
MIRRSLTTTAAAAVLSVGLVFAGSGAASAHECYVVKRSDQGSVGASHSGNWFNLTIADLLAEAPEILGAPPLNEEQTAWALAEAEAQGMPDSFAIFTRFTLPKGNTHERMINDAKGIDHFFAAYIDQLIAIYMEALTR